jgi:branched-chain amino acid aminotransferase
VPDTKIGGMAFTVVRNPSPRTDEQRAAILAAPGFGQYFTDHLVRIDWTAANGWSPGQVLPYAPLALDPATMSLHYGQEIFEGLKAYRQPDGSVATFRPEVNAERFARSARRLAMPELPAELFLESLHALVGVDSAWVPTNPSHSLYLRPFMIATEVGLGVRAANAYTYLLIGSPAGSYFPRGVQPVSVWLSTEFTRAAPGGTGEAKCAGNYAGSLVAQAHAAQQGCDQVVWLDAIEHRWVEEMGGMNLYFVYGSGASARIVTPALTGTLLPGVTRDSLLTLAQELGYGAEEGKISTDEWREGNASGALTEVFACGTAAVITPVGSVKSATGGWTVGDGEPGPITMQLRERLLAVQTGRMPDTHGWMHRLF